MISYNRFIMVMESYISMHNIRTIGLVPYTSIWETSVTSDLNIDLWNDDGTLLMSIGHQSSDYDKPNLSSDDIYIFEWLGDKDEFLKLSVSVMKNYFYKNDIALIKKMIDSAIERRSKKIAFKYKLK